MTDSTAALISHSESLLEQANMSLSGQPDNHMRLLAQRLLGKLALLKFMEQASKALGWPPKCRRPLAVPVPRDSHP